MLEVSNLAKKYGSFIAVDRLNFQVEAGETFVFLGTSGSGKTTTLKMINRLIEPTSGTLRLDKVDIRSLPPYELRRKIGYVLQNIGLFPHYTVSQNIAIVPELLKWDREKIKKRRSELLETFNLAPARYLQKYPHQLSGGEQQRVGFVRALMASPPVLLMDEPLGALDPVYRASARKEFKTLKELNGKTILIVTHDIQEAFELGDRIGLMDHGELQQTGTPFDLLFNPANAFVRNFFSGGRFELEMKAITLAQLHPFIPSQALDGGTAVSDQISVLEAMEIFSNSGQGKLVIKSEKSDSSNKAVAVDQENLITAYYGFIKQVMKKS